MKRRTWLWIAGGVLAFLVAGCFAVVGTGIFVATRQMKVTTADAETAGREFDAIRARFGGQPPIFQERGPSADSTERLRRLADQHSGPAPQNLHVLAWDEADRKTVRLTLPLWLLRFGGSGTVQLDEMDFDRMKLDVDQLEEAGPVLLLDESRSNGRVLLWTE